MAKTNHFISVTDPSTTQFQLGSGGASANSNIHDGTATTSTDLVEVRWQSDSVLANTVTRKNLFDALDLIKRFILQGGFGQPGSDANIPT